MKVQKILSDYLHGSIKKSAGDWDDIANVPDITDTFTENTQNPFDGDFWQEKFFIPPKIEDMNNDKNNLDILV